jgi:hypothetical protein
MAFELPREGTRRLRLVLSVLGVAAIVAGYIVVLLVYGTPYWRGWWAVMALILVLALFTGRALTRVVEWVMAGYRA